MFIKNFTLFFSRKYIKMVYKNGGRNSEIFSEFRPCKRYYFNGGRHYYILYCKIILNIAKDNYFKSPNA